MPNSTLFAFYPFFIAFVDSRTSLFAYHFQSKLHPTPHLILLHVLRL